MISVLMPCKDAAEYIADTLLSIQEQTFEKWELIAIDDHSSDNTAEILEKYASNDRRINVYRNTGKGIVDALTVAFEYSKFDYISRMDADDLMHPLKLEKFLEVTLKYPNTITTSKVQYFSNQSLKSGYLKYQRWLNQRVSKQDFYAEIYKECVLPSPNWMMHKSVLEKLGGFKSLDYPEDYDLCFKAYLNEVEIHGISEKLHFWRDYPERTSRNDNNYADNTFLALKLRYFIQKELDASTNLFLWGAGSKGKRIAQKLQNKDVNFQWLTDNPKKIGKSIYEIPLISSDSIKNVTSAVVIIAVANPKEQKEIKEKLNLNRHLKPFFFC